MKAFHTENYVGSDKKNYFEGWYFRHGGDFPFSFIAGVSRSEDPHSFVQYIDPSRSHVFRFALSDFSFEERDMAVRVGTNAFSLAGIRADLGAGAERVRCELGYRGVRPFRKSVYAPSVMGPFGYLPMLCNHAVVSMRHEAEGTIECGGNARAVRALGYIEKDFGSRFPENYFWMHAADDLTSVMFAVAWPLNFGMRGFLCVVSHAGKQYNLSLYTGARLAVCDFSDCQARVTVRRGKHELSFEAESAGGPDLAAPGRGGKMSHTVREDLSAACRVALRLDGKEIDVSAISRCAFECERADARSHKK